MDDKDLPEKMESEPLGEGVMLVIEAEMTLINFVVEGNTDPKAFGGADQWNSRSSPCVEFEVMNAEQLDEDVSEGSVAW